MTSLEKDIIILNEILESRIEKKLKGLEFNVPEEYYEYVIMEGKICKFKYGYAYINECLLDDCHYSYYWNENEKFMHLVVQLGTIGKRKLKETDMTFVYFSRAGKRSCNCEYHFLKKKLTTRYAALKHRNSEIKIIS